MALMLLAGAGYAMYLKQQQQAQQDATPLDPAIDLSPEAGKIGVDFLPFELNSSVLTTSLTTITFFQGDYRTIQDALARRVEAILQANPFLGGWLAHKPGDEQFKLWYDPKGTSRAPNIYTCLEPGEVPLKRSTPYSQYNDLAGDFSVKVPIATKIINQNHPLWKVTLIPDCVEHYERFALVVSISHLLGDGFTYYQLYHMLLADPGSSKLSDSATVVQALNPIRHADYGDRLVNYLGKEEAMYMQKINTNLVDKLLTKLQQSRQERQRETMLFTISNSWLRTQMERERQRRLACDQAETVDATTEEIVLTWWYQISQADVGLYPKQLRYDLDVLSAWDAGNYNSPIPYTSRDYATPQLLHDSILQGRRCGTTEDGSPTSLPMIAGRSFAVGVDWRQLAVRPGDFPYLGDGSFDIREDLHIPLFTGADLTALPDKLAIMILFAAQQKSGQIGAFVVAPSDICQRCMDSGIVDQDMKSSLMVEMVNRRGSIIDLQISDAQYAELMNSMANIKVDLDPE